MEDLRFDDDIDEHREGQSDDQSEAFTLTESNDDTEPESSDPDKDEQWLSNWRNWTDTTQFWEVYREWRIRGHSHFEALNKARDWHRKHGLREVLIDPTKAGCEELTDEEFLGADSRMTPEQEVAFNLIVSKTLKNCPSRKMRIFFVVLIRSHGLDAFFNEENFELVNKITDAYPELDKHGKVTKQNIARSLGQSVSGSGSTGIGYMHNKLKEFVISLFGESIREK